MFDSLTVTLLMVLPCFATNFVDNQQAAPFILSHSPVLNYDSFLWYPVTCFTQPNHFVYHQTIQATFVSSVNFCYPLSPHHPNNQFNENRKAVFLYLSVLLIIQSHDTELNPGPPTPKFPCGVCHKAVRWSCTRTAVACDNCDIWFHTDCMGMSSSTYEGLNRSDVTWICKNCDSPNYSSSLFESYINESSNFFQILCNIETDSQSSIPQVTSPASISHASDSAQSLNCSNASIDHDIGSPLQQSSPIKHDARKKNASRPLKVLSVNVQSLMPKKNVFGKQLKPANLISLSPMKPG